MHDVRAVFVQFADGTFRVLVYCCVTCLQQFLTTLEKHNSVNCDRPGECSPEKDYLR